MELTHTRFFPEDVCSTNLSGIYNALPKTIHTEFRHDIIDHAQASEFSHATNRVRSGLKNSLPHNGFANFSINDAGSSSDKIKVERRNTSTSTLGSSVSMESKRFLVEENDEGNQSRMSKKPRLRITITNKSSILNRSIKPKQLLTSSSDKWGFRNRAGVWITPSQQTLALLENPNLIFELQRKALAGRGKCAFRCRVSHYTK
ncbi:hypothetical protein B0O99DRAFT_680957 [Bisporella sp. PMI_857]|nr:hypothetical protein B0O99DRAFT_680957 [Bisporella sp. PMI_857]